jgi:large subunit ribosomal protein L24e
MVLKTTLCRFSGLRIWPGRGMLFIRTDNQQYLFLNKKCKSMYNNRLRPAKLAWTTTYRSVGGGGKGGGAANSFRFLKSGKLASQKASSGTWSNIRLPLCGGGDAARYAERKTAPLRPPTLEITTGVCDNVGETSPTQTKAGWGAQGGGGVCVCVKGPSAGMLGQAVLRRQQLAQGGRTSPLASSPTAGQQQGQQQHLAAPLEGQVQKKTPRQGAWSSTSASQGCVQRSSSNTAARVCQQPCSVTCNGASAAVTPWNQLVGKHCSCESAAVGATVACRAGGRGVLVPADILSSAQQKQQARPRAGRVRMGSFRNQRQVDLAGHHSQYAAPDDVDGLWEWGWGFWHQRCCISALSLSTCGAQPFCMGAGVHKLSQQGHLLYRCPGCCHSARWLAGAAELVGGSCRACGTAVLYWLPWSH